MVLICPDCGYENIDGIDECEGCQQSLTSLSKPKPPDSPIAQSMLADRISELEPKMPVAVAPDTPIGEVMQTMVEKGIGSVLVADDGQLVGIFSERDVLIRLNTEFSALRDRPISEFMTHSPGTLEMQNKIAFAVQKMAVGGYRHIPIVEGGRPIGVISIRDILRYTTEQLQAAGE